MIAQLTLRFLLMLTIPVLSVLYAGLLLSALISILAGILRTLGVEQIKMGIWHGIELPVALSVPLSLAVSALLVIGSFYVRRSIRYCVAKVRL